MMNKFKTILKNEFKHFLSDKGLILIMLVGVTLYFFCYALPYYNEIIKEVPTGIVDLDNTNFSKKFIQQIDTTDAINIKEHYLSNQDAQQGFYKGDIRAFITIPHDFEKDILKGKQTNILFYGDSAYLIIYKTVYKSVFATACEIGAKTEVAKMMKSGVPKQIALATKEPFKLIDMPLFNSVGGYKSYTYPMILILILHQTLILGIGLLQGTRNEKKCKYCDNEKDIPFTIFARSTFYIFLYLFYGSVVFLMFPAIFTYPIYYNLLPLLIFYITFLYSVTFFAQTISYWFKMREAVLLVIVPVSLIFLFIPGLIWPKESIPTIINILAKFVPATCGIDGIIKINQNGASFFNIIDDYLWLVFLAIFYFITACILTKKLDELNKK